MRYNPDDDMTIAADDATVDKTDKLDKSGAPFIPGHPHPYRDLSLTVRRTLRDRLGLAIAQNDPSLRGKS